MGNDGDKLINIGWEPTKGLIQCLVCDKVFLPMKFGPVHSELAYSAEAALALRMKGVDISSGLCGDCETARARKDRKR